MNERYAFADLLDRVLSGTSNLEEWGELVMTHYADAELEQIRHECARLGVAEPNFLTLVENHSARLSAWANALRA